MSGDRIQPQPQPQPQPQQSLRTMDDEGDLINQAALLSQALSDRPAGRLGPFVTELLQISERYQQLALSTTLEDPSVEDTIDCEISTNTTRLPALVCQCET